MLFSIYEITDETNGKKYIGQTRHSINHRLGKHITRAVNPLVIAMLEHGPDNFTIDTLATTDTIEDAIAIEKRLIEEHNTLIPSGYNSPPGRQKAIDWIEELACGG